MARLNRSRSMLVARMPLAALSCALVALSLLLSPSLACAEEGGVQVASALAAPSGPTEEKAAAGAVSLSYRLMRELHVASGVAVGIAAVVSVPSPNEARSATGW